MEDQTPARRGKIASLPAAIREELCKRLHDGQRGPQILPWLNGLPEVLAVLDNFGEEPSTAQNLSEWRQGGYQDFLRKLERIERTRLLADYCRKMGDAGAGQLGLPAALAGGSIMAALENFDPELLKIVLAEKPEKLVDLMMAMASMQSAQAKMKQADAGAETVKQRQQALEQREAQLALNERRVQVSEKQLQLKQCEAFVEWAADDEARKIAVGTGTKEVKVAALMKRMFGDAPARLSDGPAPWDVPKQSISGGG